MSQPTLTLLGGRSADDAAGPANPKPDRGGLDWFVFFVADIQTGFGPFVAVYLTTQHWTQTDIGLVLTLGGLFGLAAQIPAGALVDAVRSVRAAAAASVLGVAASAFALALWPGFLVVAVSRLLQAGAGCVLGLAITRISLDVAGRADAGRRFGRNAAFASIGTGLTAAAMGACGYYVSNRAVFWLTGLLALPALVALARIADLPPMRDAQPSLAAPDAGRSRALLHDLLGLARNRALVVFAACVVLFHLANASMLSLAAGLLSVHAAQAASAMVAASIVVPQIIVAVLSPFVGSRSHSWGRKPLLVIGFTALSLRAVVFASTAEPALLVAAQLLDGVSAAVLGVLVPLTIADVTRRSGHFGLAQGAVGCAMGIGASASTSLSGFLTDRMSSGIAFLALAAVAVLGLLGVSMLMPETRDIE